MCFMGFGFLLNIVTKRRVFLLYCYGMPGMGFRRFGKLLYKTKSSPEHERSFIIKYIAEKLGNLVNRLYFDIRSEKLYREAEDAFYYFENAQGALRYLELALELSPNALKLLMFKGNILLCEGFFEEALDCFTAAKALAPKNVKVLAGISNCYDFLGESERALYYANIAFREVKNPLDKMFKPLYDLKTSILIRSGRFAEAKTMLERARFNLLSSDLDDLRAFKLPFIKTRPKPRIRTAQLKLSLV